MRSMIEPSKKKIWAYLTPGILIYAFVVFIPILYAIYYSFFDWSGGTHMTFIKFENYSKLIRDMDFWGAIKNNLILVVVCIIGQIGLAFVMSILLNSRQARNKQLHMSIAFFPSTLAAIVIGSVWSIIFDYRYGLLNWALTALGHGDSIQPWLSNPKLSIYFVAIPVIWQFIGYYLIIIMSAYSSIDKSLLEAAEIDGATAIQQSRYITLPIIKPALVVCLVLCIAGNMKIFDHIYVMTGGSANTMVGAMYAYNVSFKMMKMGYGSAVAIGILLVSLVITFASKQLSSLGANND